MYNVGDFMTRKENLHAVKPTTTLKKIFHTLLVVLTIIFTLLFFNLCFVCIALETLVEKRIMGFPVINDNWKLVIPYFFPVALLLVLSLFIL